ncbi:MAG: DUF11 domain-containing protein, partial [Verrucomicrobia bacterium]
DEVGYGIAIDGAGNVYVTGSMLMLNCDSGDPDYVLCPPDFPTLNAFQPVFGGDPLELSSDAFVVKINNSSNPSRLFATYLGGADDDYGYGITVDSSTNIYVTGETSSTNFPVLNGFQSSEADGGFYTDAFLFKFDSTGSSLLYSTYFGGTRFDGGRSVVVDRFGVAYIVGYTTSTDLPITPNAVQTNRAGTGAAQDLFIAKLNPSVPGPSSRVFASYFGGTNDEAIEAGAYTDHPGIGLAVDTNLNIYFASDTYSGDLPTTAGAFRVTSLGDSEAFAVKIASPTDISVSVVASTSLITLGSNIVFTLYANNNGLTSFSNVTAVEKLSPNLTFVSGTNSGGTISNFSGTVTCFFNTLTNGAARSATITAAANATGQNTNTAWITATQADLNTLNNTSTVVTVVRGFANLGLSMTESQDPVTFGSNITYSIVVTNRGPSTATSVIVTNQIPVGFGYVAAFGGDVVPYTNANAVIWTLFGLANGGSANLALVLQAQTPGVTTNQAGGWAYEADPATSDNTVSLTTTIGQLADVAIRSMTDSPDPVLATSNLTYTISVTNSGPTLANSVQVVDSLPAGKLSYVSATSSSGTCTQFQGVVTCSLGMISSGAVATVTIVAKPGMNGLVTNSATVSTSGTDVTATNNSATNVTVVNQLANLAIGKTASPANVVVTSNVVYTLSVTNLGPTSASGVLVTDPLPANFQVVSATSSVGTCTVSNTVVTCNLGTMNSNSTATVTITARSLYEGPKSNTGSVSATSTDPIAGNNSSTALITVTNHPAGPILRIFTAKNGNSNVVVVNWTTNSPGYLLQFNTNNFNTNFWLATSATTNPVTSGPQKFVTNGISTRPTMYRLIK